MNFLESAKNFFVSKSLNFLLLGLTFIPLINFFKLCLKHLLGIDNPIITIVLLFGSFGFYYTLLLDDNKLKSVFFKIANTNMFQTFLIFCLFLEHLLFSTRIILIIFTASLSQIYFHLVVGNPLYEFLFQILFVLFLFYYRLRRKVLNVYAFADAGMEIPEGRPLTWSDLLYGIETVLQQQSKPALVQQGPKGAAPLAQSNSLTPANADDRGPASGAYHIISQKPIRNDIKFPLFQIKRGLSGKAVLKELYKAGLEAAKKDPVPAINATTVLVGAAAGAAAGGCYTVIKDARDSRIMKELETKKIEEQAKDRELQAKIHNDNLKIQQDTLDYKYAKLRVKSSQGQAVDSSKVDLKTGPDTLGNSSQASSNVAAAAGRVPDGSSAVPPFVPCPIERNSLLKWFSNLIDIML